MMMTTIGGQWDLRNCDPDRLMAAFMVPSDHCARKKAAMEQRTERIHRDAIEARDRNREAPVRLNVEAVTNDISFLLGRIAELEREGRQTRNSLAERHKEARRTRELVNRAHSELNDAGFPEGAIDERCKDLCKSMDAQIDRKARAMVAKGPRSNDRHDAMINEMAAQINNAMNSLKAAGVKDVCGEIDTRLARRIDHLAAQRESKATAVAVAVAHGDVARRRVVAAQEIIVDVHKALDNAKVPKDSSSTLLARVMPVLAVWDTARSVRTLLTMTGGLKRDGGT